jgi:enolase-phosphatase E1
MLKANNYNNQQLTTNNQLIIMKIQAIVTDIEGTTSSIEFVHKVLFPYSVKIIPEYLRNYAQEPEIAAIITAIKQEIDKENASLDEVIKTLMSWIKQDKKNTSLKALQGIVWEYGFRNNEFKGHLYEDAYRNLEKWHQQDIKLYVFSSGSIKAQQLLFGNNEYGDLTYLFSDYFDTNIGSKKEIAAYQSIATTIQTNPENILFLSDVVAELDAAKAAGYNTILVVRDELPKKSDRHIIVNNFDRITTNN